MIQNLNKLSFAGFGTVLNDHSENHGFPTGDDWTEAVQTVTAEGATVYCAEGPVFLDFEAGMTVLAVEQGEKTQCFYLDKPVCILAGVRFAIVPYQQECSVKICFGTSSAPLPVAPFQHREEFKLSRKLKVGNIYTMFYQEKEKGFFFQGRKAHGAGTDLCGQGAAAQRGRRCGLSAATGRYDDLQRRPVAYAVR